MKKLITLVIIVGILTIGYFICVGADKNVIYKKDTKEVIGVVTQIIPSKDSSMVNIKCEDNTIKCGVNLDKILIIAIDEKNIPSDLSRITYKIDTNTKEIYQEVILGEQ